MRVPLTPHGLRELLVVVLLFGAAAVVALLAFPFPWGPLAAVVPAVLLAFGVSFFRDPARTVPPDETLVVSPADGTVSDVTELHHAPWMDGPATRIGVFLSVFDVHVNRMPVAGVVRHLAFHEGAFLDARDPAAPTENESQDVGLEVTDLEGRSYRVLVRQISGLIARTIVCTAREGQRLARGERFGMIKFGSRTELYLPKAVVASIDVSVGDKVKGGSQPVARLKVPVPGSPPRPAGAEASP